MPGFASLVVLLSNWRLVFGLGVLGFCGGRWGFCLGLFCFFKRCACGGCGWDTQDAWKRRRIDELQLDTGRDLRVDALTDLFAPDSIERNRNVMNPDARCFFASRV